MYVQVMYIDRYDCGCTGDGRSAHTIAHLCANPKCEYINLSHNFFRKVDGEIQPAQALGSKTTAHQIFSTSAKHLILTVHQLFEVLTNVHQLSISPWLRIYNLHVCIYTYIIYIYNNYPFRGDIPKLQDII